MMHHILGSRILKSLVLLSLFGCPFLYIIALHEVSDGFTEA